MLRRPLFVAAVTQFAATQCGRLEMTRLATLWTDQKVWSDNTAETSKDPCQFVRSFDVAAG